MLIFAAVFDAVDIQPDACHDEQEATEEQRIAVGEGRQTGANECYCTYNNKDNT